MDTDNQSSLAPMELESDLQYLDDNHLNEHVVELNTPTPRSRKRRARAKTPIVDDEVRRCSRFRKNEAQNLVQLDREPRRKKGEDKKKVYFSKVEDLKAAIICQILDAEMESVEIEPIPVAMLVDHGTSFCGVPPEELTEATLFLEDEE